MTIISRLHSTVSPEPAESAMGSHPSLYASYVYVCMYVREKKYSLGARVHIYIYTYFNILYIYSYLMGDFERRCVCI